jgi:hypothetical protein
VNNSKVTKITTRNIKKAMANNRTTTKTTNNTSTLQIKNNINKNNKNLDRIINKEQKSTEEKVHIAEIRSPMLFNLDNAITRAQESRNICNSTTLSDPLHKNEEKVVKTVVKSSFNDELRGGDGESSDSSVNSGASIKKLRVYSEFAFKKHQKSRYV